MVSLEHQIPKMTNLKSAIVQVFHSATFCFIIGVLGFMYFHIRCSKAFDTLDKHTMVLSALKICLCLAAPELI